MNRNKGDMSPPHQKELYKKALEENYLDRFDNIIAGLNKVGKELGYLNSFHVFDVDALDIQSLSLGMIKGRKLVRKYIDFFREYVPGCEDMELVTTATLMGVRESRRIKGEYQLNYEDYKARRKFHDQIGVFNKEIDIHLYKPNEEEYQRYFEEFHKSGKYDIGESYGIPYGILVPKGWRNLWVAGRCASTDVKVHGSLRVQPAAAMMGEAAGTAAVQSINTGKNANDLNTKKLVKTLRSQGAYLPQEELKKDMTRN